MASVIAEGLESRRLFSGAQMAAEVFTRLVQAPREYDETFVTVISGKQKLTAPLPGPDVKTSRRKKITFHFDHRRC